MIGRSAIRNPWIFRQIREAQLKVPVFEPTMADVFEYIIDLYTSLEKPELEERKKVGRIKKFLNFVGLSVDSEGDFLHQMRRTQTQKDLFDVCESHLIKKGNAECLYNLEPFEGLVARPSAEAPLDSCQLV
jgi:tRNA-dihydrouridine synthase